MILSLTKIAQELLSIDPKAIVSSSPTKPRRHLAISIECPRGKIDRAQAVMPRVLLFRRPRLSLIKRRERKKRARKVGGGVRKKSLTEKVVNSTKPINWANRAKNSLWKYLLHRQLFAPTCAAVRFSFSSVLEGYPCTHILWHFDLRVPYCLYSLSILQDLQLPQQNDKTKKKVIKL